MDRAQLIAQLNRLTPIELNEIIFAVGMPLAQQPSPSAPHGDRVFVFLKWAESLNGCGLAAIAARSGISADTITQPDSTPKPKEASMTNDPIEVFFSYSHKDEELRDELAKHLSILKRNGVISQWHDRKISAGSEWKTKIDDHLNSAHIILLLISADFLASDYCFDIEMKRAMERHEAGEARVIPVILRDCDWSDAVFGKLQALPKDAKPVMGWPNKDEAFTNIAKGIKTAVTELQGHP